MLCENFTVFWGSSPDCYSWFGFEAVFQFISDRLPVRGRKKREEKDQSTEGTKMTYCFRNV